jgi:hypothetical protein
MLRHHSKIREQELLVRSVDVENVRYGVLAPPSKISNSQGTSL